MAESDRLIGVDIGGTKCAVVLGDRQGLPLQRLAFPTRVERGPALIIEELIQAIGLLLEKNAVPATRVISIGVACGGPLDAEEGLLLSPPNLPGWDEVPIVRILEQHFHRRTYLQNDANACAVAEWRHGAARGCRNLVFLTFGTGLGAGLIIDGRLYKGANGLAGEAGHIRLARRGPVGYGKAGSFEGFCSGGGIAQLARAEVQKRLDRGEAVGFCPTMNAAERLTAQDVGLAAVEGDPVATGILKKSGRRLGEGLAILIDLFNPERIIIGGIFPRCRAIIQPAAEAVIEKEALAMARRRCTILPAELGESIGDYACLSVALGLEVYQN